MIRGEWVPEDCVDSKCRHNDDWSHACDLEESPEETAGMGKCRGAWAAFCN